MIRILPNKLFKLKKKKVKRTKTYTFQYGQQDLADIISYSGLKEEASYIIIDEKYVRTLFISGYP